MYAIFSIAHIGEATRDRLKEEFSENFSDIRLCEIIYIISNNTQAMNTKLFFIAIAIVATFSIAVTAVTSNVSAQNTTEGNMTSDNMTSMTSNLTMGTDDKYTAGS